ncbi:acyl-CoA:lysophosphatidylglycerol acyltransferase 1-like [Artemia franciscana]|uniref:Phospholipid/glycerol acyltransferase domain-containing protein n=1 Tax=Artemia franciscana TaxID=6661 RepID=A0AA88HHJ9_ARTSF|nr:hypothetical protein QYM36_015354 [Artemia franciscana]
MGFIQSCLKYLKYCLRMAFIITNNIYCIPTHLAWMTFFWPLKRYYITLWLAIESQLYEWLLTMVSIWCYSAGYNVVEMGDDISIISEDEALFMYNHQSTADVPLIMCTMTSKKKSTKTMMWIMDTLFKWTNFGWVSQIHKDFFIVSGKQAREDAISRLKSHLLEFYVPYKLKWIVLFPEGGFLRKRKLVAQSYAKKNGLPHLERVSLPRVGALQTILETLNTPKTIEDNNLNLKSSEECHKHMKYIVDVTIAYTNGKPLDIFDILIGRSEPRDTVFHYRVYSVSQLPEKNSEIATWMYDRYAEKDEMLESYYRTGVYPDKDYTQFRKMKSRKLPTDYTYFILLHLFFIASSLFHLSLLSSLWSLFVA